MKKWESEILKEYCDDCGMEDKYCSMNTRKSCGSPYFEIMKREIKKAVEEGNNKDEVFSKRGIK